jgi:hypothetical protein
MGLAVSDLDGMEMRILCSCGWYTKVHGYG